MSELSEVIQSADWRTEKHVPAIECPDQVTADELFAVKVTLGKAVAHPNTTEHHEGGDTHVGMHVFLGGNE